MDIQAIVDEELLRYQNSHRMNATLSDFEVEAIIRHAVERATKLPTATNSQCPLCNSTIVVAIADCQYVGVPVKFGGGDHEIS